MKHDAYDPTDKPDAPYGAGGLTACRVCHGCEGSLPTDCPGRGLTALEEARIYAGELDYRDLYTGVDGTVAGYWIIPKEGWNGRVNSPAQPTNFEDVGAFHAKFGLRCSRRLAGRPMELTSAEAEFRIKFLLEELLEYLDAMGYEWDTDADGRPTITSHWVGTPPQDLPKAFDALLDLVYVALGTAHMHRFPWQAGWDEVQRANITKERCGIDHPFVPCADRDGYGDFDHCAYTKGGPECGRPKAAHSLRGSALDVIKPAGWTAPDVAKVLRDAGWKDREVDRD